MKNIYPFALALFALATTACSDDDNNEQPPVPEPVIETISFEAANSPDQANPTISPIPAPKTLTTSSAPNSFTIITIP